MRYSVFISFRTPDKDIILPLYKRMQEEGIHVFMSSEDLEYGEQWGAQLDARMKEADLMLAFVTPEYLSQQYQVNKEWNLADQYKKLILPIVYQTEEGAIPHAWAYHSGHQYMSVCELNDEEIEKIVLKCKQSIERGRVIIEPGELLQNAHRLADDGKWEEAVRLYEKVSDDLLDAYPQIIFCRLMMGQYKEARDAARNALTQCPNNPDTYFFSALSNLAGRSEYPSQVLERTTELLMKAWRIEPSLVMCYLAICLAHLYNRRSYTIPPSINELVRISKEYEYDEKLLNSLRGILGI